MIFNFVAAQWSENKRKTFWLPSGNWAQGLIALPKTTVRLELRLCTKTAKIYSYRMEFNNHTFRESPPNTGYSQFYSKKLFLYI